MIVRCLFQYVYFLSCRDFFEDVLSEFQRCGKVLQFKVCANASPHLRGNVYVQFLSEEDAGKACALFNGRWYAGRQLTCYLVTIEKWKSALCGKHYNSSLIWYLGW